jgi:hypothetical protein
MNAKTITEILRKYPEEIKGLFVGGSLSWKFQTCRMWADLSHLYNIKCHVGRIGTYEGFIHMHYCNIDSVDSSTATRHNDNTHIQKYFSHLKSQKQLGVKE